MHTAPRDLASGVLISAQELNDWRIPQGMIILTQISYKNLLWILMLFQSFQKIFVIAPSIKPESLGVLSWMRKEAKGSK
jgi:hypothetical protein